MNLTDILGDFGEFTEQYELRRTLNVVMNDTTYRVEVLYCCSNPNARWTARVYAEKDASWKRVVEFPWVADKDEESSIRSALNFLAERASRAAPSGR